MPASADETLDALAAGTHSDPFSVLGPCHGPHGTFVRTLQPGASGVTLLCGTGLELPMTRVHAGGIFESAPVEAASYRLRIDWGGSSQEIDDPYRYGPLLGRDEIRDLAEGRKLRLAECLGAIPVAIGGVEGVRFAVWAPNARRVSVIGSFNNWDGRRHPMRFRHDAGVWEIFIPELSAGVLYKYEILQHSGEVQQKSDPVARQVEGPPATASIVAPVPAFRWRDGAWCAAREARADRPLSIYEVHAPSWRRHPDGRPLLWRELADTLIPYVRDLGFTHIEFLPLTAHPFGGSWGYQPLSQFAPLPALGTPEELADFVDRCHAAGLGVILDWVPGHFPTDAHGLVRFDGTALYEHEDPREGFHQDWNTLIYNLGRTEVRNFLIASAVFWLETFHIDGLRVDAVASMLYRDYSRQPGEWIPNRHGGRENLEAVAFLRELSAAIAEDVPGAMLIAEESTAWPGVSHPVEQGGLGFTHKWNMGWMHDTLRYVGHDPVHRKFSHHDMTFGLVYAFSERFVLPISHDEVVHGKRSLLGKMPGDAWQRLANLRLYLAFMWTQPGKKLLFMGQEFGQSAEWNHDAELNWPEAATPEHAALRLLLRDLNHLYRDAPSLSCTDFDPGGFRWVVEDDADQSVFAWLRHVGNDPNALLVLCNFTPVPRERYRVGVPLPGRWREVLNTDAVEYGGSGLGNLGGIDSDDRPAHGFAQSLSLTLPPLAALILRAES
ncbi:glycogen branching enzyme [Acidiphilium multivorum AIU301]|nr:1,4-alpha-glucan branching protein GlgB [Acidiphilium multivorum]GAN74499.1 glycogen branching enzyme [Acidiphilium multivorum AIU301]